MTYAVYAQEPNKPKTRLFLGRTKYALGQKTKDQLMQEFGLNPERLIGIKVSARNILLVII